MLLPKLLEGKEDFIAFVELYGSLKREYNQKKNRLYGDADSFEMHYIYDSCPLGSFVGMDSSTLSEMPRDLLDYGLDFLVRMEIELIKLISSGERVEREIALKLSAHNAKRINHTRF